ncbi:MAG: helix-turn-helix transcriptional regulator [Oligoflexales bacterium]
MLKVFGDTQQKILRLLQRNGDGVTVDFLAQELEITRTAIKQHLTSLSHDGFVRESGIRETGGRPVRTYILAPDGHDLFQKQYSWFSELLMQAWKKEIGDEGIRKMMRKLAEEIASKYADIVKGKEPGDKTAAIVQLMNSLAFEAEAIEESNDANLGGIVAWNCVYHRLAKEFPEVCDFDIALLERLSGQAIDHKECIIRGGKACRFHFRK